MPKQHADAAPLVTVVIIFLNGERYLEEAVQSVFDQSLTLWELILVDDGSTDRSSEIACKFAAQDARIRYVEHPGHQNRGMSASRNLGVANGSAPYIAFLDADDVWLPNKLAEQVELLENNPEIALAAGAIEYWYSWDAVSVRADHVVLTGGLADRRLEPPEAILTLHPLGPGGGAGVAVMVRRNVFDAVGGFEEQFRGLYEDQGFLTKVYLRYPIYISSRKWLRYRQHDTSCLGGMSRTSRLRLRREFLVWLQNYVGPSGDTRVIEAIRRARREIPLRLTIAPLYEVFDRLPQDLQTRLRVVAGRTAR